MLGAGRFPRGHDAELVFQLEHNSLGSFFSKPADLRERRDVGIDDGGLESVDAHSAQDRERELRADAADVVDEEPKQIAFGGGHEAVKNLRVFADVEMSEDLHGLTGRGKFVVARQRDENFVADAADLDDGLRR